MRSSRLLAALVAALTLSAFAPLPYGAVYLYNESSFTVLYLYTSPCEMDEWGDDLLGDDVLEPGGEGIITVDAGCWDLRAVTDDGTELEHYGLEVEDGGEAEWVIYDE